MTREMAVGGDSGAATPRSPLRNRTLQVITLSEFISALGSRMSALAVPWFVLTTTGSVSKMGLAYAVELVPMVVLGVPSASIVRRFGIRNTMLTGDAACAVLVALIPLLHLAGALPYWLLLVLLFAISAFAMPYEACQRLLIPQVFGGDEVLQTKANALLTTSTQISGLAGPPLAGVLIALIGAPNLLWLDACSFAISLAILVSGMPRRAVRDEDEPDDGRRHGALAGARFVAGDPLVRRVALVSLICGAFFPVLIASLPVVTDMRYQANARIAGLLLAAWSVGSVLGLLGVLKVAERLAPSRLAALGAIGVAAPLWLLVLPLTWWEFGLVLVASSLFVSLLNSPMLTLFMSRTPDEIKPQAIAYLMTVNALAGPIGYAVAGPALQGWGVTTVEGIVAAGMTAASLLLLTIPGLERRYPTLTAAQDSDEAAGDAPDDSKAPAPHPA